jgi:uncharacterized protein (TIGR03905 family)
MTYRTEGTCSRIIEFDVEGDVLKSVRFVGGCDGNLQGISQLASGMKVSDVIERLRGIDCDGKGTSCPDQLSRALEAALSPRAR